jgi:hypothetical protein
MTFVLSFFITNMIVNGGQWTNCFFFFFFFFRHAFLYQVQQHEKIKN